MRSAPPIRAGARPHIAIAGAALLVGVASLAACTTGDAQETPPIVLGMTDQIAPSYSDQELTLYEVQTPVELPVRKPNDQERQALQGLGDQPPYPRAPFLLVDDTRVEIRFTLSNLDDQEHTIELLLDPWNEFVRYRPGIQVVSDEETVPNFSGYDKFFVLPGKSRTQGTITSDDMRELAIDLATVQNILAQPVDPMAAMSPTMLVNRAFNLQNRSNDGDPLLTPLIPKVIAGVTGFDLGLRGYAAGNVAVEITIDVTDVNGNRVIEPGNSDPSITPMGIPHTILSPPAANPMM
jgi:hypothetical protein